MRAQAWLPRLVSLLMVGGIAAAIGWWGPRLGAPTPAIAPNASAGNATSPDATAAAALFGALAPQSADSPTLNFKALGVVSGRRGSALISVDGKPMRSVALGEEVEGGWRLLAIESDHVVLERAGVRSELAAPARANLAVLVGNLAAPGAGAGPSASDKEIRP